MHASRHRGRGGRPQGRGRSGWGPPRHGGGGRRRRGDVRSAILALLDERPMHGYEMIQTLEERTGGRWRPSAGSIYPTLQLLEDEGLVSADEVEGRKVFSLSDAGRKALEERAGQKLPWENGNDEEAPLQQLRAVAYQVGAAAMQVGQAGSEGQVRKAVELLTESRRRLYSLLAEE